MAAGVGMVLKLAAGHTEKDSTVALGIITDVADAVVGLGAAIHAAAPSGPVEIGGRTLVYVRGVLVSTIDRLRDETWTCPCPGPHAVGLTCGVCESLVADLKRVAGWVLDDTEQGGTAR